jgi:hypothetical protein
VGIDGRSDARHARNGHWCLCNEATPLDQFRGNARAATGVVVLIVAIPDHRPFLGKRGWNSNVPPTKGFLLSCVSRTSSVWDVMSSLRKRIPGPCHAPWSLLT